MAAVAMSLLVRTGQGEARIPRVIEAPAIPAIRVVTAGTRTRQTAFVPDILMAPFARQRRFLESIRAMAAFAWNGGVKSDEREPRQIVIE